jgi:hypothetical protein
LKLQNYQQVATTLSNYFAYLMFFIPELLPGKSTDTTFVLKNMILERCRLLGKGKPSRDELPMVTTYYSKSSNNNNAYTISKINWTTLFFLINR